MTLSQALDYLRQRHNETGASSNYWTDQELYQLISGRSQTACAVIGLIEVTDTSVSTVIDQQAYEWPTTAVSIKNMLYDGTALQELSFREQEVEKNNGLMPSGTPYGYWNWNRQVLLVPAPASVKVLTFYYEKLHPYIDDATDTIDIPSALHFALMDGVLSDMYAKTQNTNLMTFYENKWSEHMRYTFPVYKDREKNRGRAKTLIDSDTDPQSNRGLF